MTNETNEGKALDRLIRPRSIAVVGASAERRSIASVVLANLKAFRFFGDLHLVSRTRQEIDGTPCVAQISELPTGVDVAVLCIPQSGVIAALESCVERGIGAAVVFASGYAEAGEAGRRAQEELAAFARAAGLSLVGPNCMGLCNLVDRAPLSFTEFAPNVGEGECAVAVIAQSGAMMGSITTSFQARNVAVTYAFSTGNEAVLGVCDFLDFVLGDPHTRVIAIFVEKLRDAQRFLSLAEQARMAGKRIVLLHTGRSWRARASAATHTGAIAGDHAVMEVMVRERGVVLVSSFEELFDVSVVLLRYAAPPECPGIAIVTNSGAFGGFALDYCDELGLPIAQTSEATREKLRTVLPPYVGIENFVDLGTAGRGAPTVYGDSCRMLLDDDRVGQLLIAMVAGSPASQLSKANSILPQLSSESKRVAFALLGDESPLDPEFVSLVRQSHVPFFRSGERAMRALAALTAHDPFTARRQRPPPGEAGLHPIPPLTPGPLSEHAAKELLRAIGVATPPGRLTRSPGEARGVAAEVGYPVALKAQAANLTHKSDFGFVEAPIGDAQGLEAAWQAMEARLARRAIGRLDGFLVEAFVPHDLELVVGARRDPDWGPIVVFGMGGLWVEAFHDVRLLPADATPSRIITEMERLRAAPLFRGERNATPVDLAAFAVLVTRIGAFIVGHPEIRELDLNPVVPTPTGFVALDALIVVDSQFPAASKSMDSPPTFSA